MAIRIFRVALCQGLTARFPSKMNVKNRTGATAIAREEGIVD